MTYKIYTLGCKVNTYESNVMADILENNGYKLVDNNADVAIINTCSVTNEADKKSRKIINKAKLENPNAIIIAVGCMVQNKKDAKADIVIGNTSKSKIIDLINEYKGSKINKVSDVMHTKFESMKLNNFNKTRAFVKIQDGCNNFCSYCIIPFVRGNVRSKDKLDVLDEIKTLTKNGHKEIVLTGIHTGHYGEELDNYKFSDLLNDILKIDNLERLRISSIEITELDQKFLDLLKNNKVLVDHMHIPLQSGSNSILKKMNRKYDKEYFIEKINKIRSVRPDISITTDVIVGFPTETIDEHLETIETIKKINFSKIHVFPYSDREGTIASKMKDHVDLNQKKQRVDDLLKISKELEINYMNKFINKELEFIPEVCKDNYLIGHTSNYLLIKALGNESKLNENVKVILKEINYPYIIGEIVEK